MRLDTYADYCNMRDAIRQGRVAMRSLTWSERIPADVGGAECHVDVAEDGLPCTCQRFDSFGPAKVFHSVRLRNETGEPEQTGRCKCGRRYKATWGHDGWVTAFWTERPKEEA